MHCSLSLHSGGCRSRSGRGDRARPLLAGGALADVEMETSSAMAASATAKPAGPTGTRALKRAKSDSGAPINQVRVPGCAQPSQEQYVRGQTAGGDSGSWCGGQVLPGA